MTIPTKTTFAPWVELIAKSEQMTLSEQKSQFPFQKYSSDKEWSSKFIEGLKNKRIGEVGKLAIHKDHRNGDTLLNELISSFLDYCIHEHQIETGFGSCTIVLERFYRKFGFYIPDGSKPFAYEGLPEAVILRFDP